MTGRLVDPSCPVNWSHPLNRGLAGWWAGLPNSGWTGGKTLHDLTRGGRTPNDGTFTTDPTWAAELPGGLRGLTFAGAGSVSAAAAAGHVGTGDFTASFWVRTTTAGVYGVFSGGRNVTVGVVGWTVWLFDGVPYLTINDSGGFDQGGASSSVHDGLWHYLTVVATRASAATFYADGKSIGTLALTRTGTLSNATNPLNMGAFSGNVFPATGRYGDFQLRTRALAQAEVVALYDQARRGHPDTLAWLRPWSFGADAASPPPPPAAAFVAAFAPGF